MAELIKDNNSSSILNNDSILAKLNGAKKNFAIKDNNLKSADKNTISKGPDTPVTTVNQKSISTAQNLTEKLLEKEKKSLQAEEYEKKKKNEQILNNARELFGDGFTDNEYKDLYSMYQDYSNNYPTENSIHRRALIKVCKCTLRYDQALSSNDTDSIKIWNTALKDALNEAKINPSQLSAADLSEGLTSFSQLSARVEKMEGPITVVDQLNKYIWEPQDLVDYTIWQYVNYNMSLVGKPLIKYKDVYTFMERQAEENHKRYAKFLKKEEEITDPSILDPLGDYE